MKKFGGNRSLAVIKKAVKQNGWKWDQQSYDQGGDWVNFQFQDRHVTYNTFNGRFMVQHKVAGENTGKTITETSTDMEGTQWYDDLLDFIYLPAMAKKKEPKNAKR